MYWYELVCIVWNGLYWYAFACNGINCKYWWVLVGTQLYLCVLVLTVYWYVLACIVCIWGICMYWSYISQYFMYWPVVLCTPNSVYNWHVLTVYVCICLCWCTVCILLCLLVLTWRYLHVLVCIVCINQYCTLWYVLI